MIRVAIAEDLSNWRDYLKMHLESQREIEVVGEAANGVEALELVRSTQPDVLTLDLEMPTLNGFEVINALRAQDSKVRILVISSYSEKYFVQDVIASGASGYLYKGDDLQALGAAIHSIFHKKATWYSESIQKLFGVPRGA